MAFSSTQDKMQNTSYGLQGPCALVLLCSPLSARPLLAHHTQSPWPYFSNLKYV